MLQHVSLETRPSDVDAAIAFWALLGFVEVERPEGLRATSRWVQRAGTQVHLLLSDDPVAPPEGHAAVVVDDYDGTLDRLRAAGHDPQPTAQHWAVPRAFVRSPGGHRVELMSAPPPPPSP